jgi:hypothetical protein
VWEPVEKPIAMVRADEHQRIDGTPTNLLKERGLHLLTVQTYDEPLVRAHVIRVPCSVPEAPLAKDDVSLIQQALTPGSVRDRVTFVAVLKHPPFWEFSEVVDEIFGELEVVTSEQYRLYHQLRPSGAFES